MELKRSWMFVPGHRQKMIDKALSLNADAIMLDIEDGVAPNEKDTARQLIAAALGREKAPAIAACSPRVCGLMFGAEDFGRELGLPTSREGEARDMLYARSAMVIAAASAHVQAIDGVWVDLKDTEGLAGFARQSRRLGFSAMSLIHPSQIDPINQMFSPTPDEIDYAQRVVQ